MQAADVMTFGAASIRADAPVEEAARVMLQHRISGLPVVDHNRGLVGMVTEGDLLRREASTQRAGGWNSCLPAPDHRHPLDAMALQDVRNLLDRRVLAHRNHGTGHDLSYGCRVRQLRPIRGFHRAELD